MKDLLYLKDEQIKVYSITLLRLQGNFSDPKEVLSKKFLTGSFKGFKFDRRQSWY